MTMTRRQMLVKYLEKENVPYVLGIPGHGILGFFDALREEDKAGKIHLQNVRLPAHSEPGGI